MALRKSGTKKTVKSNDKQFTLDMVIVKKPTVKKTAAKKPTTKKPTAAKKTTVKKTVTKKPTIKKTTATKKPTVKKTTAAKKTTVKKPTAKFSCKLYVDGIFEKSFKADSYDEIEREKRIAYQETGADEVEVKVESQEFTNTKKSLVGRKPVIKKSSDSSSSVKKPTARRIDPNKIVEYKVENEDYDIFGKGIKSVEKARVIAAYHCDEDDTMYITGYNANHDEIYLETLVWFNDSSDLGFYCERIINNNTKDEYMEYCRIDPKTGKIINARNYYRDYVPATYPYRLK